jgi:hypothetical protein
VPENRTSKGPIGVAVGDGLTVAVGVGLAVAVGDGLTVAVGVGLAVADGDGLAVAVGVGLGDGATTVTAAVADLLPSFFEVAVIIALPGAAPVTAPLDDTVATGVAEEDQLTSLSGEPLLYVTVAASVAVCPTFRVVDTGVADTDITVGVGLGLGVGVGVGATTVTVAVADLDASFFEVALIVALPAATPFTTPLDVTVTTDVAEEDQLTSLSGEPLLYVTVATSVAS